MRGIISCGMDWQLIVPAAAEELRQADLGRAWEVRLRPGQPVTARMPEGLWRGRHILTPDEVFRAAQALCGHGLAAHQRALSQGFLPLPGGHRLGVCGVMGADGLREITSLCVRVCRDMPGVGADVFPQLRGYHTLIVGPPGSGKTTLLRDIVRLYGLSGYQEGVADERGEIAACREGRPLLNVGPLCDVVTGLRKSAAIPLLIRAMAPQVIATDEIGGPGDAAALAEALRCGVTILATAHGTGLPDVRNRRGMDALVDLFQRCVVLTGPGETPRVIQLKEENA